MSSKLLTRAEVAQLLSVSLRTVDRLRREGILPALKVFTTVRFREEDVRRFISGQQGAAR
jgi:excisionase family DNA binding protein